MKRAPDVLDAALQLLDRQVVDPDDRQLCNIDDLEFTEQRGGAPYVTAILYGPGALAGRFHGVFARFLRGIHRRMHPDERPQPARIEFSKVQAVDSRVVVAHNAAVGHPALFEVWVRDNVIAKIPGSAHAAE
ncbi:MAG: hypothetical protein ABR520_10150 [Mycobacteriales bacterium]|nr:hypothetical protein [Frankia sp.]